MRLLPLFALVFACAKDPGGSGSTSTGSPTGTPVGASTATGTGTGTGTGAATGTATGTGTATATGTGSGTGTGTGTTPPAPRLVGGTLGGLVGSVTLQNLGGDDLVLTADGAFQFATPVLEGEVYDVAVSVQPVSPDQVCTVAMGTGTAGPTDVSDVVVDCVTDQFTVGGTVSGLVGSLTLQNNGADDLVLGADGAFVFATAVDHLGAYEVTVADAPPDQLCTVGAGSGVVSAQVDSVTVDCGARWVLPADLTDHVSLPTGESWEVVSALDSHGDAMIAWTQEDPTGVWQVYRSEVRGGVWTVPVDGYDSVTTAAVGAGNIAADGGTDGMALVYVEDDAFTETTWAVAGPGWSAPSVIWDDWNLTQPVVNLSADDRVAVAINSSVSGASRVFVADYDVRAAGAWTVPSGAADYLGGNLLEALAPQIAVNAMGEIEVVYSGPDTVNVGCGFYCYGHFRADYGVTVPGAWTEPIDSTDHLGPPLTRASGLGQAVNESGQTLYVWSQATVDPSPIELFTADRGLTTPGAWTLPASLSDAVTAEGTEIYCPAVALNDAGEALVAWSQNTATGFQIRYAERSAGVWNWSAGTLSDPASAAGCPDVEIADNGDAMVVWTQDDGTTDCYGGDCERVYVAQRRAGAWILPALADAIAPPAADAEALGLQLNDAGQAMITWRAWDGATTRIYAARYR